MDEIEVWKVNKKMEKKTTCNDFFSKASDNFVLDNFKGFLDSETGKTVTYSKLDGSVVTRDISPESFDEVVRILEEHQDKALIIGKTDIMWLHGDR